jgi:hypothetical protein
VRGNLVQKPICVLRTGMGEIVPHLRSRRDSLAMTFKNRSIQVSRAFPQKKVVPDDIREMNTLQGLETGGANRAIYGAAGFPNLGHAHGMIEAGRARHPLLPSPQAERGRG